MKYLENNKLTGGKDVDVEFDEGNSTKERITEIIM